MPATSLRKELHLPPPFELAILREAGDAYGEACSRASRVGAGTVFWVPRFHLAEFALVLEPDEPLQTARTIVYAAGNALYNALSLHAPPQFGISYDWPGTLRVDGALVGGLRLGWPQDSSETEAPDWLVVGVMVRTEVSRAGEPGERVAFGGLSEQGFEDVSPGMIVEDFCRYFAREASDRAAEGPGPVAERWSFRAQDETLRLLPDGDGEREGLVLSLARHLAEPAWLDRRTGEPHL